MTHLLDVNVLLAANTLAKLARDIGLRFALRKGRPEKGPNLLPPG